MDIQTCKGAEKWGDSKRAIGWCIFCYPSKDIGKFEAAILSRTGHNFHTHSTSNKHGMFFFVCLAMMRQKDSKERCVEHSVLIFGLAIMCLERS